MLLALYKGHPFLLDALHFVSKRPRRYSSRPTLFFAELVALNFYERMRHESSSLPGDAVEVGVREALLDLGQEVPARGAVSNLVTGRAAFVFS